MRKPALSLAAFALALLAAAPSPVRADDLSYYYEEIYEPYFKRDAERPGWVVPARSGSNAAPFEEKKPAGTLRVFIVGGSTAGGYWGEGDLAWGLKAALPGRKVEVINCGMSGYDSAREHLVLRDVLRYEPDLVVFFSGHNDFFINNGPPPPRWLARVAVPLMRRPWYKALAERLRGGRSVEALSSPAVRRKRLAGLVANVRAHARDCKAAGVRAVFCLPPLAFEEMTPLDGAFPFGDPRFAEGWAAFVRGRAGEAAAAWRAAASRLEPKDETLAGFVWSYLARAEERSRHPEAAREAWLRAAETRNGSNVCPPSCLASVADAARAEGALVVDVDAAFRRAAAPKLPGIEQFVDEIHWRVASHGLITMALLEALRTEPALRDGWRQPPRAPKPLPESLDVHRRGAIFYAVQKVEIFGLHGRVGARPLRWISEAARMWPSDFSSEAAAQDTARAIYAEYEQKRLRPGLHRSALPSREPPAARLAAYLGAAALEEGDCRRASELLESAQARGVDLEETPLWLGAARAACGRSDEARALLAQAKKAGYEREAAGLAAALGL